MNPAGMNPVALTVIASIVAAIFFALRANLLKPEHACSPSAPAVIRLMVVLQAAGCAVHAQAVFLLQRATVTELLLATAVASYAVALWLNVRLQRGSEKRASASMQGRALVS